MDHYLTHVFLLIIGLSAWIYAATPMLRGMLDTIEGRYKWQSLLWVSVMIAGIFLIKFSLYSLTSWPAPGTWASRLFLGMGLFASYSVPFGQNWIKGLFKNR